MGVKMIEVRRVEDVFVVTYLRDGDAAARAVVPQSNLDPSEAKAVEGAWSILEGHTSAVVDARPTDPADLRKLIDDANEAQIRHAVADRERSRVERETIAMTARHAELVKIIDSHERQAADADAKNDEAHVALMAKQLELDSVSAAVEEKLAKVKRREPADG